MILNCKIYSRGQSTGSTWNLIFLRSGVMYNFKFSKKFEFGTYWMQISNRIRPAEFRKLCCLTMGTVLFHVLLAIQLTFLCKVAYISFIPPEKPSPQIKLGIMKSFVRVMSRDGKLLNTRVWEQEKKKLGIEPVIKFNCLELEVCWFEYITEAAKRIFNRWKSPYL